MHNIFHIVLHWQVSGVGMVPNAVRRRNNDKLDWISNQSRLNLYSCVSPVMVYSTSQVLMLNIFEIKKMHFMNYEANII